jgi:hypothetical protein
MFQQKREKVSSQQFGNTLLGKIRNNYPPSDISEQFTLTAFAILALSLQHTPPTLDLIALPFHTHSSSDLAGKV